MTTPSIMCTLTPVQVADTALVAAMRLAGMDSVRLNTAHLDGVEALGQIARCLKALCPGVLILIDTKGPEMRTVALAAPVTMATGQTVSISGDDKAQADIHVNYADLHRFAIPGQRLLIDDGRIALRIDSVAGSVIRATVRRGGILGSRKGIALEGVDLPLPSLSDKDRDYIRFAASCPDIDVIAHSFVRCADDVRAVRALMDNPKPIIAKIENQQGIDHLPDIIAVADGILIARGDLTASIGADNIPAAQARIAAAAKAAGRPLYLATNILSSLAATDTPSEADARGIALARSQGVDVMLLTNETAASTRPVRAVQVLAQFVY